MYAIHRNTKIRPTECDHFGPNLFKGSCLYPVKLLFVFLHVNIFSSRALICYQISDHPRQKTPKKQVLMVQNTIITHHIGQTSDHHLPTFRCTFKGKDFFLNSSQHTLFTHFIKSQSNHSFNSKESFLSKNCFTT